MKSLRGIIGKSTKERSARAKSQAIEKAKNRPNSRKNESSSLTKHGGGSYGVKK